MERGKVTMPYQSITDPPQAVRDKYSQDALKRFIAVFNDIMEKTGDEARAMAAAHTAAQASGKVQIAEAHAQIATEMASRGIAHEAADAVDALVKTTLELPDSIMLVPGCVSVEATSPDSPGEEPTFIVKLDSLTDEAVHALLEALPVNYGIIKFDPADSQDTKLYNLVLERTKQNTIDVWTASQQGLSEDELAAELIRLLPDLGKVSDSPWQFSEKDYGTADHYCGACLIDLNPGAPKIKGMCKLPVREPGGALNSNGVHAAAQRLSGVDAPAEAKKAAAKKLLALYAELGDEPPASLVDLAKAEETENPFHARILKADNEQRMVYGVVMEPESVDTQGDFAHPQEIEKAAHDYLERKQKLGFMHKMFGFGKTLRIMESYLAPCDFEMNGETVKKGSWVMAVRVLEEALWQAVKKGEVTGFSIGGTGKRVTIEPA